MLPSLHSFTRSLQCMEAVAGKSIKVDLVVTNCHILSVVI
jgi:hypothetical protein